MKENVDLIKEISSLRLEIREEDIKKNPDEEKKNKNEPTEEMIRNEINERKRAINELQEKIEAMERREESYWSYYALLFVQNRLIRYVKFDIFINLILTNSHKFPIIFVLR